MIYICSECGCQIPDDSDFCHRCGCMKSKALRMDGDNLVTDGRCHSCGSPVGPSDDFCGSCGAALARQMPIIRMRKNGTIALMLALIPSFFNVFGLGHLVLKQWSRGAMFFCMTFILWYITPMLSESYMLLLFIKLGLFMYHASDIFRAVYSPEAS